MALNLSHSGALSAGPIFITEAPNAALARGVTSEMEGVTAIGELLIGPKRTMSCFDDYHILATIAIVLFFVISLPGNTFG